MPICANYVASLCVASLFPRAWRCVVAAPGRCAAIALRCDGLTLVLLLFVSLVMCACPDAGRCSSTCWIALHCTHCTLRCTAFDFLCCAVPCAPLSASQLPSDMSSFVAGSCGSSFSTNCSISCAAGHKLVGSPYQCVDGQTMGQQTCQVCPPGASSAGGLQAQCTPCAAGTFALANQTASCTLCPPGTASAAVGAAAPSTCATCTSGRFSAAAGASTCQECVAGSYSPTPSQCEQCPPGTFNALVGQSSCRMCAANSYTNVTGATLCNACPPSTPHSLPGTMSLARCCAQPIDADSAAFRATTQLAQAPSSAAVCGPEVSADFAFVVNFIALANQRTDAC